MAVNNDKIFNNNFDTPEFELGSISFELDPSIKDNQNEEETIIKSYYKQLNDKDVGI